MATYFDPDRQSNVDYTNVKKVLDDVLPGYAQSGGTFTRPIRKYGKHVFSHNTTFCCVKQPPGGQKGAYYAIHHMRAIVRDHHQLLLPSKLKDWAASVSAIQDADLRQEFFASSRSLRKSSIKMSFVPRGSSTSDINRPTVTSTQSYNCTMTTPVLS